VNPRDSWESILKIWWRMDKARANSGRTPVVRSGQVRGTPRAVAGTAADVVCLLTYGYARAFALSSARSLARRRWLSTTRPFAWQHEH
jgi:hypothetical protein